MRTIGLYRFAILSRIAFFQPQVLPSSTSKDLPLPLPSQYRIWLPLSLLIISAFICFWRLGTVEMVNWDETYYGGLAKGMQETGDPFNYYFGGKLDNWNAKPPLYIWLLSGVFSLFGTSPFTLRLISALSIVIFIQVAYRLIRNYQGPWFAWLSCLILLGANGIIGEHVGRSGDTDALQVLLITSGLSCFLAYVDFEKKWAIVWAALFFALAFWNKSVTAFFALPACFAYLLLRRQLIPSFRDKRFWAALGLGVGLIASWFLLSRQFGHTYEIQEFGDDMLDVMVSYDIIDRFGPQDATGAINYDFFPVFLDTKFNLWNFVFYLVILLLIVQTIQRRKALKLRLKPSLSAFAWLTFPGIAFLLTFSKAEFSWYMAPYLLFIVVVTVGGIRTIAHWKRWTLFLFGGLLCVTLFQNTYRIAKAPTETGFGLEVNSTIEGFSGASVLGNCNPADYFRLNMRYADSEMVWEPEKWPNLSGNRLFMHDSEFHGTPGPEFTVIAKAGTRSFYRKKSPTPANNSFSTSNNHSR